MHGQGVLDSPKLLHHRLHLFRICAAQPVADHIHFFFQLKQPGECRFQSIAYCHPFLQRRVLIQISHADIFRPFDLSGIRLRLSGHDLKESRFSFTVRPYQADMLTPQEAEGHIFKDCPVSKPMRQVFHI